MERKERKPKGEKGRYMEVRRRGEEEELQRSRGGEKRSKCMEGKEGRIRRAWRGKEVGLQG